VRPCDDAGWWRSSITYHSVVWDILSGVAISKISADGKPATYKFNGYCALSLPTLVSSAFQLTAVLYEAQKK